MIMNKKIFFDPINSFNFDITYHSGKCLIINDQHVHDTCEIYINLSGDVSFMVEDNIYSILPGNIILTRPYEAHHCIYHSNKNHDHYNILVSCNKNESLFKLFFNREKGKNNLIFLPDQSVENISNICATLINTELSTVEQYHYFFKLMSIINSGSISDYSQQSIPKEILETINRINNNISDKITISSLAQHVHLSINTFERQFKQHIGLKPTQYIKRKRLTVSAAYLLAGSSIQDACYKSGFSDYSYYIAEFKKFYGVTPLGYKKMATEKGNSMR